MTTYRFYVAGLLAMTACAPRATSDATAPKPAPTGSAEAPPKPRKLRPGEAAIAARPEVGPWFNRCEERAAEVLEDADRMIILSPSLKAQHLRRLVIDELQTTRALANGLDSEPADDRHESLVAKCLDSLQLPARIFAPRRCGNEYHRGHDH